MLLRHRSATIVWPLLQTSVSCSANIFDNLECLSAPKAEDLRDELDKYLSSDPVHVIDAIKWWYDRCNIYPRLSRMAMDYLTILCKCFNNALLISFHHLFMQLHPLMCSECFPKAASSYRICAAACQLNRHALLFVLGCEASRAMWKIAMWGQRHCMLWSREQRL